MKCYGVGTVAGLGTVIILEDMGRAQDVIQSILMFHNLITSIQYHFLALSEPKCLIVELLL